MQQLQLGVKNLSNRELSDKIGINVLLQKFMQQIHFIQEKKSNKGVDFY